MATGYACYHHSNDHDRAAVANCTKCGKALCAECTDLFRSRKTGKILCIECLNGEIANNENLCARASARAKKEITQMIVGLVIGFIIAIIVAASGSGAGVAALAFIYLPFLFASFGLIWTYSFGNFGFIIGLIAFIGMVAVSPIMFIVRVVKRVKNRKVLAEAIVFNQQARATNNEFLTYARSIKSGLNAAEMQKLIFQIQTAQAQQKSLSMELDLKSKALAAAQQSGDSAEVEAIKAQMAEMQKNMDAQTEKTASLQKQMDESGAQQAEFNKDLKDKLVNVQDGLADQGDALNAMMRSGKKKAA